MGINVNSKRIVIDTLKFKRPQCIPRQLWALPWAEERYPREIEKIRSNYPSDIVIAPSFYKTQLPQIGSKFKKGIFIDEWGCTRISIENGISGEVKNHLVKDWKDIKKVHIPKERLTIDIDKINDFCSKTEKFILAGAIQRPFERMQFIRRTDNLFIDLIEQPEGFKKLLGEVHEFYKEEIKLWCETNIDGIFIMDDWGAQNSLLINPELWKKIWKPMYKEYIDIAHKYGKYAFMHSDGNIFSIIPELVEIGLDALNTQLFCMDIEEIGKRFKGEITFWGEIDRQHLLPYGSMKDIELAVKKVYENLYLNGGVIAQCEFGPGAKPENIQQVFKTWDTLCKYE